MKLSECICGNPRCRQQPLGRMIGAGLVITAVVTAAATVAILVFP